MSAERPHWPAVLRPFVAYRPPPAFVPMRSESAREAWADVSRFLDRAAKPYARTGRTITIFTRRWSAESALDKFASVFGEWPSECTKADFDDAVHLAHERFGSPRFRSSARKLATDGMEFDSGWHVGTDRIDDVLEFIESVPACTGGEFAPVHAAYSAVLVLRNLDTRAVLPRQGTRYYPQLSSIYVQLQRRCSADLKLIFPFAEPDEVAANYVVALQEHAPVWLDPRYFDHAIPAPDGSRFRRTRLPPSWIGTTPAGELRLDASRSGITPADVKLPTDEEMAAEDLAGDEAQFQTNYRVVANALREQSLGTVVIRGAADARYMVEQAAAWLEMPLHVISTGDGAKRPGVADELRSVVSGLDERRAVLFLEIESWTNAKTDATLLSQIAGRVLLGVELPAELRLVVAVEAEPGEAARAAMSRFSAAMGEGFLTSEQREFLSRRVRGARWRDVVVEVLPLPQSR